MTTINPQSPFTPRKKAETNRTVFSKTFLDSLSATPSGSKKTANWAWHYDIHVPGLAIGVGPSGVKSFYLIRKFKRKARRILIGKYPTVNLKTARQIAQDHNAKLAQGIDPTEKTKEGLNFGELFEKFMKEHSSQKNWTFEMNVKTYDRYLATDRYATNLSKKMVNEITKEHMRNIFSGVTKHAPVHANRVLALMRCVFNKAIAWDIREGDNPCTGIERNPEQSRERRVSRFEIPYLFKSLGYETNETLRDFVFICLFTGARRGNVLPMRWEEIDFEACHWNIDRTKNGTAQTIPLVPALVEILKARRKKISSEWVFPASSSVGHYVEPKKAWKTLLDRATALRLVDHLAAHHSWPDTEIDLAVNYVLAEPTAALDAYALMMIEARIELKPLDMRDLHVHDLRRTLGSWQADLNISLAIIGQTLNHKSPQSTKVYARLSLDPVRMAMEAATAAMLTHKASNRTIAD